MFMQGSFVLYDEGAFVTERVPPRLDLLSFQWVIESINPEKKDEAVKAKQLEALKRLGHAELKLDEYERTFRGLLRMYMVDNLSSP